MLERFSSRIYQERRGEMMTVYPTYLRIFAIFSWGLERVGGWWGLGGLGGLGSQGLEGLGFFFFWIVARARSYATVLSRASGDQN